MRVRSPFIPLAFLSIVAAGLFFLNGCMTKRQCVNTCEAVLKYQAAEMSGRQLERDSKCLMQKMDLEMCREEVKALRGACE